MAELEKCDTCGLMRRWVCHDSVCEDCHIDVSFMDCVTRSDAVERLLDLGHPHELLREMYPNAKQWRS